MQKRVTKTLVDVSDMLGHTLSKVICNTDNGAISFKATNDLWWEMYHEQDCCESVRLIDVEGEFSYLVGNPILVAKENSQRGCYGVCKERYCESCTWTFYKFATIKGHLDMRWHGESNGYYSESVSLYRMELLGES